MGTWLECRHDRSIRSAYIEIYRYNDKKFQRILNAQSKIQEIFQYGLEYLADRIVERFRELNKLNSTDPMVTNRRSRLERIKNSWIQFGLTHPKFDSAGIRSYLGGLILLGQFEVYFPQLEARFGPEAITKSICQPWTYNQTLIVMAIRDIRDELVLSLLQRGKEYLTPELGREMLMECAYKNRSEKIVRTILHLGSGRDWKTGIEMLIGEPHRSPMIRRLTLSNRDHLNQILPWIRIFLNWGGRMEDLMDPFNSGTETILKILRYRCWNVSALFHALGASVDNLPFVDQYPPGARAQYFREVIDLSNEYRLSLRFQVYFESSLVQRLISVIPDE